MMSNKAINTDDLPITLKKRNKAISTYDLPITLKKDNENGYINGS